MANEFEDIEGVPIGVLVVHGFNVHDDGKRTTRRTYPRLSMAGFDVIPYEYGWVGLFDTRFNTENEVQGIIDHAEQWVSNHQGGVLVGYGHSHGCFLLNQASHRQAPIHAMHWQNPALDEESVPFFFCRRANVFHSHDDWVVAVSEARPVMGWGQMGKTGYIGDDPRMYNTEMTRRLNSGYIGHSGVYSDDVLPKYMDLVVRSIKTLALEVVMGKTVEV